MQVRLRPFVLYNWKSPFATREVNVYCPHLRLFLTCLTFQIRRLHPSFLPSQNCVILRVEIKSGNYGWDTGEQIPVLSLPVCYYKYSNIIFNNMIIYIECFCANYRRKAIPFQSTTKGIFSIIYSLCEGLRSHCFQKATWWFMNYGMSDSKLMTLARCPSLLFQAKTLETADNLYIIAPVISSCLFTTFKQSSLIRNVQVKKVVSECDFSCSWWRPTL